MIVRFRIKYRFEVNSEDDKLVPMGTQSGTMKRLTIPFKDVKVYRRTIDGTHPPRLWHSQLGLSPL